MTAIPHRRPWQGAAAVSGGLVSLVCFVMLHLLMADVVDPLQQPVSSYALISPGTELFGLGTMSIAGACVLLAFVGLGVPGQNRARAMLAATSVMLTLVVVFRTDAGDTVSSIAGQIHRYAAGAAFVLVVLAAASMCRELTGTAGDRRWGFWMWGLTVLSVATLLLTALNTFLPELAGGGDWRGLPQRALLLNQTLIVIVMGLVARRRTRVVPSPVTWPRPRLESAVEATGGNRKVLSA